MSSKSTNAYVQEITPIVQSSASTQNAQTVENDNLRKESLLVTLITIKNGIPTQHQFRTNHTSEMYNKCVSIVKNGKDKWKTIVNGELVEVKHIENEVTGETSPCIFNKESNEWEVIPRKVEIITTKLGVIINKENEILVDNPVLFGMHIDTPIKGVITEYISKNGVMRDVFALNDAELNAIIENWKNFVPFNRRNDSGNGMQSDRQAHRTTTAIMPI